MAIFFYLFLFDILLFILFLFTTLNASGCQNLDSGENH